MYFFKRIILSDSILHYMKGEVHIGKTKRYKEINHF